METSIAKSECFQVQSTVNHSGRVATLVFVGDLNEEAKLDEVSAYLRKLVGEIERAVLELEGIRSLNSAGVRQWLSFIEALPSEFPVFFSKVSEVLVDQANLVPNILGSKIESILSLFAPYVCVKCGARSPIEVHIDGRAAGSREKTSSDLREKPCAQCGGRAELDGLADEYFGFLNQFATA